MIMKTPAFILSLFVCFFFTTNITVYAQSDDDGVKTLGEILNPQTDDMASVATAKEMTQIYYKRCIAEKSLAFDKQEKELLCTCTAANMGQVITVSEFNNMYKDNIKAKDTRGKVIAFAYTECMNYVIESKLYNDCMVSPALNSVIRGKKNICECSSAEYVKTINNEASYIIMEALKYNPMTLNPLEHFFTTKNYGYMADKYTESCKYKMLYKKYN